ncbi:MAG: hypothetical protein LBK03_00935 [Bacteroidales bacterium]|jgi:hypothetical protein|nr:hypothetical protein [Bacteroidales bacterium]
MNKKLVAVIAAVVVASGMLFYACEKEGKEKETNKSSKLQTLQNPYDYFGELHNLAMEQLFELYQKENQVDIPSFAKKFMINEMDKINTDLSSSQWAERFDKDIAYLNDYIQSICLSPNPIDFSDSYFASLTNFQKETLQKLFDGIESCADVETLPDFITAIEQDVLGREDMLMKEKEIVLGTVSIAKYSYQFFVSYFPEDKYDTKGLSSWGEKCMKVLKADAVGFAAGVVGGVIQGQVAVGMVFGPGGAVATLAADGTIGAVVGSGSAILRK